MKFFLFTICFWIGLHLFVDYRDLNQWKQWLGIILIAVCMGIAKNYIDKKGGG